MKEKLVLIIIGFLLFTACGKPGNEKEMEWLKGGKLHKAKVPEWKNATDENKLATCADFVVNVKSTQNEKYTVNSLLEVSRLHKQYKKTSKLIAFKSPGFFLKPKIENNQNIYIFFYLQINGFILV
jgi:hypothetical protein